MNERLHIAFAGGVTGGHLFPGLAVAREFQRQAPRSRITFAGGGSDFERRHVGQAGHEYQSFPSHPWPRRSAEIWPFLTRNLGGFARARWFLRQEQVALVIGLGGFASVPLAQAATRLGIPLVLLEQNAVPGRANRWLARRASAICLAMDEARSHFSAHAPLHVTGNPLREEFVAWASSDAGQRRDVGRNLERDPSRQKTLLILGGSQGANDLNERLPEALAALRPELRGWRIVHQSGQRGLESARRSYAERGLDANVVPFLSDMARAMAGADLVICRAGGTTLAELALVGAPALLVPFAQSSGNHQLRNAEAFALARACTLVGPDNSRNSKPDRLSAAIGQLLIQEETRQSMSQAILLRGREHATRDVVDLLLHRLGGMKIEPNRVWNVWQTEPHPV